jgi:hypothetical protein
MSKKSRTLFQNITIALISVAVAFLLLELAARWLPTPFDGSSNLADTAWDRTGWRGKPHYQTTVGTEGYYHVLALNSAGMHDTEHHQAKPAGTFRILMLGDSFVQAVQVKEAETSHQVLENQLNNQETTLDFEVISAGVGGWGTAQQLLYYRHEGRFYQPELVLLMFFLGNDVKDNLPGRGVTVEGFNQYTPYFVLEGDKLDPEPWLYAPGLEPAINESASARKAVNNLLGRLHQSSRLYAQVEPLVAAEPVQASMLDFYIGRSDLFDYGYELTFALINQLHQEAKQDGANFGVVLVSPLSLVEFMQMNGQEREIIYQKLPGLRRAEEIPPPNQQIAQRLTQDGIPVLDLLPQFLEHAAQTGEPLYFEGDKHWNVAGNRRAGQVISTWLHQNPELLETPSQ